MMIKDCFDPNRLCRGVFRLLVWNREDECALRYVDSNLVVDNAVNIMTQLIGGDSSPISRIGFGENSALPNGGDGALSPNAFIKKLDGHTYITPCRIVFSWSLDFMEANGLNICEFGLFNLVNSLFARKVRDKAVVKTMDFRLSGNWEIELLQRSIA